MDIVTATYTTQELENTIAKYKIKYGNQILWKQILDNVYYFTQHRDEVLSDPLMCLKWQGFLHYLAWIESTIGLFGYTKVGTFHRIFVMFGRAYLEEAEIVDKTKNQALPLTWISETSKYFKAGDGRKGDIDLEDATGITYDVKNDSIDFKKSHEADFLLKYLSVTGDVEVHKKPATPEDRSYVGYLCKGRPVKDIVKALGLDPLLFDKRSTEEQIEQYLGLL